jgi:hypothetical protein
MDDRATDAGLRSDADSVQRRHYPAQVAAVGESMPGTHAVLNTCMTYIRLSLRPGSSVQHLHCCASLCTFHVLHCHRCPRMTTTLLVRPGSSDGHTAVCGSAEAKHTKQTPLTRHTAPNILLGVPHDASALDIAVVLYPEYHQDCDEVNNCCTHGYDSVAMKRANWTQLPSAEIACLRD